MNVLSLFDGMSCGQLALQRASIPYDNYFASEIDKYAIKVTQHHFPDTKQLGSVINLDCSKLPPIKLLIGGSPCKGFSQAGNKLNFEHPESKLFFEYVRIKEEVKPEYFLLENVQMKKEWEQIISKVMGVRPIRLNSSLVSAQERKRLYWTNIPVTDIPKDRHILLSDIIEEGAASRNKSYGIDANYYKGGKPGNSHQSSRRNMIITHSTQPRTGKGPGGKGPLSKTDQRAYCLDVGNSQKIEYNGNKRKLTVRECCRLQTVPDHYFDGVVSNTQAYKMLGNGWTVDIIAHILSFLPNNFMNNV